MAKPLKSPYNEKLILCKVKQKNVHLRLLEFFYQKLYNTRLHYLTQRGTLKTDYLTLII